MKIRLILLVMVLGLKINAQQISIDGQNYFIENSKIFKDGVDVTDKISKEKRAAINKTLGNNPVITKSDQEALCYNFLRKGFKALKETFEEFGTTIENGYDCVKCEDGREDLLKHRQLNYMGRSDMAAFILYYKRDLNREADLPKIFNKVVPGPRVPNGTLLDFIEYYKNMDDLDEYGRGEYEKMITLLRRFGAKKASEL